MKTLLIVAALVAAMAIPTFGQEFAPPLTAEQAGQPAELRPVEQPKPTAQEHPPTQVQPVPEALAGEIAKALKISQETGSILKKYLPYLKACQRRGWVKIERDTSFRWQRRPTKAQILAILRILPVGHKKVYQEVKSWNPASVSFVETRDRQLRGQITGIMGRIVDVRKHLDDWKPWMWVVGSLALVALVLGISALLRRRRREEVREKEPIVVPEPAAAEIQEVPALEVITAVPEAVPNTIYIL